MTDHIMKMAGKLTSARADMIMALPANGAWGKVPDRAVAKRAFSSMSPPIIEHMHCPPDKNEWRLNTLGKKLRRALETRYGY